MNGKFSRNKTVISALVLVAIIAFGVYLAARNVKSPVNTQNQTAQGPKFKLPSGSDTFQIVQAAGKRPEIVQATINPPDVHVGDTQTLSVVVSDPDGIASVEAQIQTDHSTTTLPLNYVRVVDDSEIKPSAYSVDSSGHLAIDESKLPQVASVNETTISRFLAFLNYAKPSIVKAAPGQKLLYEATWTVRDTHDTKYHTTFVVKNVKGDVNSVTLAWSDACGIPRGGAWNINTNGNCTISSPDGVDSGAATIATYTLTLNSTFAFNSGQSITVSSGAIAIGAGGSIIKTNIWAYDGDGDGYDTGTWTDQAASPGAGYYRRYTRSGADCNDGNAALWQNLNGYADNDGDGYGAGSLLAVCSGNSLPAGYVVNNTDCNDANANIYQNVTGGTDTDRDGYIAESGATSACVGAGTLVTNLRNGGNETLYKDSTGSYTWLGSIDIYGYSDCDTSTYRMWHFVSGLTGDFDQDGYSFNGTSNTICAGDSILVGGRTYWYGTYSLGTVGYYNVPLAQTLGIDCNDSNANIFQIGGGGTDRNHDHLVQESAPQSSICVGSTADNIWYNDASGAACWIRSSQITGYNQSSAADGGGLCSL